MGIIIGDRISTEDHGDYTTVIIEPLKLKWKLWLLTAWTIGFTFVGFYMIYLLTGGVYSLEVVSDQVDDVRDQQLIYLIVFLGFWLYFEYKVVKSVLWYYFGKEFIKLDTDSLWHKRAIFGYGKAHQYFYDNIKNLKQYENDATAFGNFFENAYWSVGTDEILFNYFAKQKSLGRRLDEKSAKLFIRFLEDKIKTLRKKK